jgi:hypothetical protein
MSQTHGTPNQDIHPDFPDEPTLGSVGGVHSKLLLRKGDNGNYAAARRSPEELKKRFDAANEIAPQLGDYFLRKKRQNPDWSDEANLERIRLAIVDKVAKGKWPFTEAEQAWIMDRVRERCSSI